jgi:hypothetical protein
MGSHHLGPQTMAGPPFLSQAPSLVKPPSPAKSVEPLHGSGGLPENGAWAMMRLVTHPEHPLYAKSGSTL